MIEAFIIHLERATDRRAQVDRLIDALPFAATTWPACDGWELPVSELARMKAKQDLFYPKFPFSMSTGEIACFASHRAVWQHIVDTNLTAAMVFEDDVAIEAAVFNQAATLAQKHITDFGYIQFQTRPLKPDAVQIARDGEVALLRPRVAPLRASAQMISRDAAKDLLAVSDTIDRPVDVLIQMFWETGVRPHCVAPSGVFDLAGPTTIQSRRSFAQKLVAEVRRPLFRRRIERLSVKHG